ncbi:MAG: phenylalanine--tRNA ligase subunit alpha [Candidatus Brocadiae bacterium]|nr:phenylalanine--tRNA ligase subunit alpha [Candidatus Brocadiia bacterium]
MFITLEIREDQKRLYQILWESKEFVDFHTLLYKTKMEQPMAMGTVTNGQDNGWLEVQEVLCEEVVCEKDLQKILQDGMPERRFLEILKSQSPIPMKEVSTKANEMGLKINEIIKWGSLRGWMEKQKGDLVITELGQQAIQEEDDDEKALKLCLDVKKQKEMQKDYENGLRLSPCFFLHEFQELGLDSERIKMLLKNRPELAKIKERTIRRVRLTPQGREVYPTLKVKEEEKNQLTSQDIVSGEWKNIRLRSYDVTLAAQAVYPKKCHPLQKIIQESRKAFLQMGFEEMVSPQVELGFWDFDALFQPQDHPSRDMQDTFYLKRPDLGTLPDEKLVEKIRKTHENGGDTGSIGWGYRWDEREARKMVLRTHTTATSIHSIADNPNPPRKLFCVGRVFRNETISFKHLPEFHQVDGIVIDKDASFTCLLGTIQEFYKNMGFSKMKFKPAFFPYTEPSAEVYVWMESKKCWIELGGSGIFRPEVTLPFGCKVPVMAWGLGLERLAMIRYGISDIRTLYGSDLDWLQEVRLCQ